MEIKIDVSDVEKAFERVVEAVENPQIWKMVGLDAEVDVDNNFTVEGKTTDPNAAINTGTGNKWQRRKREPRDGHPILSDTLRLRNSVYSKPGQGEVEIISDRPFYNIFHQKGTVKMPARPFMNVSQNLLKQISNRIEEAIENEFNTSD